MASDRIQEGANGGILAFVTNGGFIESNSFDKFRKVLTEEFDTVYCLNLRGAARGSGETRRKESGNVFGAGTRSTVAVIILVRKGYIGKRNGKLLYHDIGDYLSKQDKLAIVHESRKSSITWKEITPNEHGDWINQRSLTFQKLMPLYGEQGSIFRLNSLGIGTNRDAWIYGFSKSKVIEKTKQMMEAFNRQIPTDNPVRNPKEFSWTVSALRMAKNGTKLEHDSSKVSTAQYRPFTKQAVYFDRSVNERVFRQERIFPDPDTPNIGIAISDKDKNRPLWCIMTSALPDLELVYHGQYLPRWTYEKTDSDTEYERISNINADALEKFRRNLGTEEISENDVFYYVYSVLHHKTYRSLYSSNLAKEAARVPLPDSFDDFQKFARAGEQLAALHANYETVDPYDLQEEVTGDADLLNRYKVTSRKMSHPGIRGKEDESTLVINDYITLKGIPEKAHRYMVGPYSALRWVRERYHLTTDDNSGIENDPNDWSDEHGDPRYIIDLAKRIVTVSIKTVDIVDSLPELPIA